MATLGLTSIGSAGFLNTAGFALFWLANTSTAGGSITSFSVYINGAAGTENMRLGVYTDNAGQPDALILDSGSLAVAAGTGWQTFSVSGTLPAGSAYWLCMISDTNLPTKGNSTGGASRYENMGSFTALPNPASSNSNSTDVASFYLTYSVGGSTTTYPANFFANVT